MSRAAELGYPHRGDATMPKKFRRQSVLCLCSVLIAQHTWAADWVDSRVTFAIADNNLLANPMSDVTASTTLPNMQPSSSNRLFFDDYERRDTGFENLSHLVLYLKEPGYFDGLVLESALVLRAQILKTKSVVLTDDGSYIRLTQAFDRATLIMDAFPISADRFRLGYSYDLSWGGNSIFPHSEAAPGLRIQYTEGPLSFFAGAKTGLGQVEMPDGSIEEETLWGGLAGAAIDLGKQWRFELGGGYFYRGTIPKEELKFKDEEGLTHVPHAYAFGGSAQLSYHFGLAIGMPLDFRVLKNDPLRASRQLSPEEYNDATSLLIQSEFSMLGQTLQDPEQAFTTTIQSATAADVTARLKVGKWRLHALIVFREITFLLFNTPSLQPYVDLPDGAVVQPELFASLSCDYYIEGARITPGLTLGIQRPANITTSPASNTEPLGLGQQTMIIYPLTDGSGRLDSRGLLGPGENVALTFAAKLTSRFDLSPSVAILGDLSYSYDPNRRFFLQDQAGYAALTPGDPNILGFNLMLQSRF